MHYLSPKPCLSGSVQEEDLMSCVSKGYMLAQKKLNFNYKVSIQQENQKIREYLISSQKKWNILKFKQCYPELENGQEGKLNFIDCATKAINERNDLLEPVFYVISIRELAHLKMISLLSY